MEKKSRSQYVAEFKARNTPRKLVRDGHPHGLVGEARLKIILEKDLHTKFLDSEWEIIVDRLFQTNMNIPRVMAEYDLFIRGVPTTIEEFEKTMENYMVVESERKIEFFPIDKNVPDESEDSSLVTLQELSFEDVLEEESDDTQREN